MALHRDSAHRVTQLLRQASAVAALDPEIESLRGRLDAFERSAGQHRVLDLLAASVAEGHTDQPLLFAAALAEQNATPQAAAEIVAGVRQRMHRIIRDRAAAHGSGMYTEAAKKFDAAAAKLLAANAVVDIEAPAEAVVDLADKARRAWREAPDLAAELDRYAVSLHACAVLAGLAADDHGGEIQICVDAGDCDPATIEAAWNIRDTEARAARAASNAGVMIGMPTPTRTRCGRWSALLALGAVIRARQPELATAV